MHHRHIEDSPQCRTEVMPGEDQPAMMRGDAPNKVQHSDGQKHRADFQRNLLHRRAEFRHGYSRPGRLRYRHQTASNRESPTVLHVLEANGPAVIPVLWTCKHRLLGLRREVTAVWTRSEFLLWKQISLQRPTVTAPA